MILITLSSIAGDPSGSFRKKILEIKPKTLLELRLTVRNRTLHEYIRVVALQELVKVLKRDKLLQADYNAIIFVIKFLVDEKEPSLVRLEAAKTLNELELKLIDQV